MHITDNKNSVWCPFTLHPQVIHSKLRSGIMLHHTCNGTCRCGKAAAANDGARPRRMARLEHVKARDTHWVGRPRGSKIVVVRSG